MALNEKLQIPASKNVETRVLSGLLQFPQKYVEVDAFLTSDCFYSATQKENVTLFNVIKSFLDEGKTLEPALLAEKIKGLGVQFNELLPLEFIETLKLIQISEAGFLDSVKELVKIKIRRELFFLCKRQATYLCKESQDRPIDEIIATIDKLSGDVVNSYIGTNEPKNLFENIAGVVENYSKENREEPGLITHWPNFNRFYGGICLRESYCFAGRSEMGKSTLIDDLAFTIGNCIDQTSIIGQKSPAVIKLDTEMPYEQVQLRLISKMSGVAPYYITTGKFKRNQELYDKVIKASKELEKMKYFYIYCAGWSAEEMACEVKRFVYKYIGRKNPFVLAFDYLKIDNDNLSGNNNSYIALGRKLDRLNDLVKEKLNGALIFGVQRNRSAIATAKTPADDSDGSMADSDMIQRLASFTAIVKRRELEDLAEIPIEKFGSHRLLITKAGRVGGIANRGHNDYVKIKGKYVKNFINLDFNLFNVVEKGCAEDIKNYLEGSSLLNKLEKMNDKTLL